MTCYCLEQGTDGTKSHSDPSGVVLESPHHKGQYAYPCLNHLHNYKDSEWKVVEAGLYTGRTASSVEMMLKEKEEKDRLTADKIRKAYESLKEKNLKELFTYSPLTTSGPRPINWDDKRWLKKQFDEYSETVKIDLLPKEYLDQLEKETSEKLAKEAEDNKRKLTHKMLSDLAEEERKKKLEETNKKISDLTAKRNEKRIEELEARVKELEEANEALNEKLDLFSYAIHYIASFDPAHFDVIASKAFRMVKQVAVACVDMTRRAGGK